MVQQIHIRAVSHRLADVLIGAARFSGEQLSLMMERDIRVQGTHVERVRLEALPGLLAGAERVVTAVYLAFEGDIDGHVVLLFAPEMAAQLVGVLLMTPPPASIEPDTMEGSALGEVGNVTTASFLNEVARRCDLTVYPSPPTVVHDMVGALLDGIVLEMAMESSYALLLHATFELEGDALQGDFVLLPSAAACDKLEGRVDTCPR